MDTTREEQLKRLVHDYTSGAEAEFSARWDVWPIQADNPGPAEVLIGLLHRQYVLAVSMATNPGIWTVDVAPCLLRSMVEVYIWLAWILKEPEERAKKFLEDGLGKEKLVIKHRTDEMKEQGIDPEGDMSLQFSKAWIESHMFSFFIDVNLSASWSGLDIRTMAEEAGCRDFYRFTYPMFSATVHSTWNHIGKYDLTICQNPLHGHHRIPLMTPTPLTEDFLFLGAKYLDKAFNLVDEALHLKVEVPSTFESLFFEHAEKEKDEPEVV